MHLGELSDVSQGSQYAWSEKQHSDGPGASILYQMVHRRKQK